MSARGLLLALTILIVMVGLELPPWVLACGLFFTAWAAVVEFWQLARPPRWVTNTLTMLFLVIIVMKYRTLMNQEASSSFLLLLTSLKILEGHTLRDQKFLFLLGFVMISSLFLFSLEIPALTGGLLGFGILWFAQNPRVRPGPLFVRALPIALLLFIFFPRLQNPFGFRGLNTQQAGTGFSDDLNPGSISRIQTMKELAFRVNFLNKSHQLRTSDQYWRGQILNLSQGLQWTKTSSQVKERALEKITAPDYEVTLEPHGKRWLFTWDPTRQVQGMNFVVLQREGGYFESVSPIYQRVTYQGKIATQEEAAQNKNIDLQIPDQITPKFRDFAETLRKQNHTADKIAEALLAHYQKEGFLYSKNPGSGSSTLDDFLFKSKKGYCEHYAATTATLLRLAQVPARVVTGYQGGEYNSYGDFWRFSQADAHAWVEYQNDAHQWQRIDPTSVVAPERLELGGTLFEDLPEEWIGKNKAGDFLKSRQAWWIRAKDLIGQNFDSLNYNLVIFLVDFNLEKQKELLQSSSLWIVAGVLILISLYLFLSVARRQRHTPTQKWRLKLEALAKKQNLEREPDETLRSFIARWISIKPAAEKPLRQILEAYECEEYGSGSNRLTGKEVLSLIKELRD